MTVKNLALMSLVIFRKYFRKYPKVSHTLLFCFFNTILCTPVFSQINTTIVCGDDKLISLQRQLVPGYDKRVQDYNLVLKEYIQRRLSQSNIIAGVNGV